MWRKVGVLALLAMALAFVHGEPLLAAASSAALSCVLTACVFYVPSAQEQDEFDVVEVSGNANNGSLLERVADVLRRRLDAGARGPDACARAAAPGLRYAGQAVHPVPEPCVYNGNWQWGS